MFKKIVFLLIFPVVLFGLQKVTLQVEWKHQFEFAGFYAAKMQGYYKKVGLELEIKEYHDNIDISDDVLHGVSDFGISSSALIRDRLHGKDVVLIASYFKQNVLALATQKNIKTITDLKGKKIMILPYEFSHTSLGVMLEQNGIKKDDFTLVKNDFNIDKFLNDKIDAMSIFITNQPYLLKESHKEFNILSPANYGLFSYDLELFTSQEFMRKHPQRTKDFVNATNRGWQYAFAHKDEIVNLIYEKYSQKKSKKALYYEAVMTEKLFKRDIFTIGSIVPELILLNAQIYEDHGRYKKKKDLIHLIELYMGKKITNTAIKFDTNRVISLTSKEKNYLKNRNIRMCIDPHWMPFEKLDNGSYIGMSADFFKIIEKNLQTKIEVLPTKSWIESLKMAKEHKCDLMSLVMQTPERKKFLNFTTPYLKMPLVLVTNLNASKITTLKDLKKNQKIGIPKGYAYSEILKKKYPNLHIVSVRNSEKGLQKVKDRVLFGYIGSLATVAYLFQHEYTGELKIAKKFKNNWELAIGVNKEDPLLLNIMQKAVNSITPNEYQEILNKWIAIKYEETTDYTLLLKSIVVGLIIFLFIFYSNRKLKRLNRALNSAKEKADETQKAKSNFLANISHEIRTPMNSILGTAYLLRETTLNNIQKNYVNKIENSTNNLLQLINDILDFSKLEVHKLQLSKVDFNLLELLDTLYTSFNQNAYEKALEFSINYDENIPKYLYGDNLKLMQILTNLLSNAVKFTEKGCVELLVEQPQENLFRFSVIDTGVGLKQSQIADIFLSFTQAESDTTRKYGGTGLGLAISKDLVELMDGEIWVNSKYARGSKFVFEVRLEVSKDKNRKISKKQTQASKDIKVESKKTDSDAVEKIFAELKSVVQKRRPQLCQPFLEELEKHEMSKMQQEKFDIVKVLIKKYKFNEAGEFL
jgi:signal transduction histidine kinase/ABC-type nitrate/sulfonate/bicarbonate transport system substrate-binding protein